MSKKNDSAQRNLKKEPALSVTSMKENVIIVSGLAGSGKSTLAEKIAKKLEWKCVHSSDIFRQIQAKQKKLDAYKTKQGKGYWESNEAMKYYQKRLQNFSFDKMVDRELLRAIKKGNVVLDSWAMPWLSKKGFKIWLSVSQQERIKRIVGRDRMNPKEAAKRLKIKEQKTARIYKKLYGFDFGKDLSPFHLVLDTTRLNQKQVFNMVLAVVKTALKNR